MLEYMCLSHTLSLCEVGRCALCSHMFPAIDVWIERGDWQAFDAKEMLDPRQELMTFLRIIITQYIRRELWCRDGIHAMSLCALCVCLLRISSSIPLNWQIIILFQALLLYMLCFVCSMAVAWMCLCTVSGGSDIFLIACVMTHSHFRSVDRVAIFFNNPVIVNWDFPIAITASNRLKNTIIIIAYAIVLSLWMEIGWLIDEAINRYGRTENTNFPAIYAIIKANIPNGNALSDPCTHWRTRSGLSVC